MGNPMLLITGCTDNSKWYAGLIGVRVPFMGVVDGEYKSREPAGYINFVAKADAKLIPNDTARRFDREKTCK